MTKIIKCILISYWLPVILAQYGGGATTTTSPTTTTTSPTATATAPNAVQTVSVGENGFTFSPDSLTVAPGGKVEFQFYPGNHSLVQAAFDNPCNPLNSTSVFSGFFPDTSGPGPSIFTVTVNDTNPIWFYCAQLGHCQAGMVGVINPPSNSSTLDSFRSAAAGTTSSSTPVNVEGGVFGPANSTTTTSPTTTSPTTTSPTTTSPPATTTATSSPSPTTTTSEAWSLRTWADMSVMFILSVIVAVFMI